MAALRRGWGRRACAAAAGPMAALRCGAAAALAAAAVLGGPAARAEERSLEEDLRPDKRSDAWTTTTEFKRDLVELFPDSRGGTCARGANDNETHRSSDHSNGDTTDDANDSDNPHIRQNDN